MQCLNIAKKGNLYECGMQSAECRMNACAIAVKKQLTHKKGPKNGPFLCVENYSAAVIVNT